MCLRKVPRKLEDIRSVVKQKDAVEACEATPQ